MIINETPPSTDVVPRTVSANFRGTASLEYRKKQPGALVGLGTTTVPRIASGSFRGTLLSDASWRASMLNPRYRIERLCTLNEVPTRMVNMPIGFASPREAKQRCPSNREMAENKFGGLPCALKNSIYFQWPHCFRRLLPQEKIAVFQPKTYT